MRTRRTTLIPALGLLLALPACDEAPVLTPDEPAVTERAHAPAGARLAGEYGFAGPAYDIAATPDGGILIADNATIRQIRPRGEIVDVVDIPVLAGEGPIGTPAVTPINGLAVVGSGSFFATRGGLDLAAGASLWRGSRGGVRLVADIEQYELDNDPDALAGPQWKTPACEAAAGYSAGPQSNPYHLTALSGGDVLIGDAAGNAVLRATTAGEIDLVALPTPPAEGGATSADPEDWMSWLTLGDGSECYVQPVPTSVAVAPDGAYYVGELTGITAENLGGSASTGLSRVWRIEPDARNVVCPSDDCDVFLSGLTSVIDLEFGPDGRLYVLEYDQNGWFAATALGQLAGGAIRSCDVETGACDMVEAGLDLILPGAITFDKWGDLWVLENTFDPTVRRVDLP